MRHWAGVAMMVAGAWLIWLAVVQRRRAAAAARDAAIRGEPPAAPPHPSLAFMAALGPPIVIFGLVFAAGQVVLTFILTDGGGGVFSVFDLAGFLILLAGYGTWLKAKTAHRAGSSLG